MSDVDLPVARVLLCVAFACTPFAAGAAGLSYAEAQDLARQSAPTCAHSRPVWPARAPR